jgi:hypothetical protein
MEVERHRGMIRNEHIGIGSNSYLKSQNLLIFRLLLKNEYFEMYI